MTAPSGNDAQALALAELRKAAARAGLRLRAAPGGGWHLQINASPKPPPLALPSLDAAARAIGAAAEARAGIAAQAAVLLAKLQAQRQAKGGAR